MVVMMASVLLSWLTHAILLGAMVGRMDAGLSLTLLCGGAAILTVAYASYREHVLTVRTVRRLRDDKSYPAVLAQLKRRVVTNADVHGREEAVREALEALILAGRWDDVPWFVARASETRRVRFARWVQGVSALASIRAGDLDAARAALASVGIEGPWLISIDALRLALGGHGQEALDRLGDEPEVSNAAIAHHRWLAEVHGLTALGRREEAARMMSRCPEWLQSVVDIEGPATSLAIGLLHADDGPFRTVH